jgi:hypothetical protein
VCMVALTVLSVIAVYVYWCIHLYMYTYHNGSKRECELNHGYINGGSHACKYGFDFNTCMREHKHEDCTALPSSSWTRPVLSLRVRVGVSSIFDFRLHFWILDARRSRMSLTSVCLRECVLARTEELPKR